MEWIKSMSVEISTGERDEEVELDEDGEPVEPDDYSEGNNN